ncbi:MAG: hypothetical protein Q4E13_05535 [Clostridia bacterium]|nr:hypothetical protein [Clostridia bacterium]
MLREDGQMVTSPDGRKKYLVLTTPSEKKYRIIKPFNAGGVGKVYLAMGTGADGKAKKFVVKEYPVPKTPLDRTTQRNIKKNLRQLIQNPVTDNGKPLDSMVPPIEVMDFPKTGSFGYVMDFVELEDFVSVVKLMENYPEADILCSMAKKISRFFDCLASCRGLCYKDVNEGNIYLNPKTGDIRIIDNDNVGDPSVKTISGTGYYMAPEVWMGQSNPDRVTDRFSLAVFLLRMFTGARPYDGMAAYDYMEKMNQGMYDAAPVIFGSQAVFIFDPADGSNTIRNVSLGFRTTDADKKVLRAWQLQTMLWDRLPQTMKDAFIQTFASGCKFADRNKRKTARHWNNLFGDLEKNIVICKHCCRKTFGDSDTCFYCGKSIPTIACKSCGKKTPSQLSKCIHCGKDPKKAPVQTIACPHCNSQNPKGTTLCSGCNKYIVITCAKCGMVCSGTERFCSYCRTALLKDCPSCGKESAQKASKCIHCGKLFPKGTVKCSVCGRMNMPGQAQCVACKSSLGGGKSTSHAVKPTSGHVLHMEITVRVGTSKNNLTIAHKFPSGAYYYLDKLVSGRPHAKLFSLMYNQKKNMYALKNCSGTVMDYRKKDAQTPEQLKDGEFVVIGPGDMFKLCDDVQMRVDTMK